MDQAYRLQLLRDALEERRKEVTVYQVNIENFRRAIDVIGDDAEMKPFRQQLQQLLAENTIEQRKARIMFDVVSAQLQEDGA